MVLAIAGCGTDDDAAIGGSENGVLMCNYDRFEVEIVAGPSRGVRVEGALLAVLQPPSSVLTGSLATTNGSVPVSGAVYRDGEISLTFHTPDGYVMGLGHVGDNFCQADAMLRGVAIGPRVSNTDLLSESDSGHWLLADPSRLLDINPGIQLPITPVDEGGLGGTEADQAGCVTNGATQTCTSGTFADAGSATGCSQSTATCTFNGTRNVCSATTIPVNCPNS